MSLRFGPGRTRLGTARYMQTEGIIRDDGKIEATTETYNANWLNGYRGRGMLLLGDENGITIGNVYSPAYGVDGTWIGRSRRTDFWTGDIGPELAKRVKQIRIHHFWDPNSWNTTLNKVNDFIKQGKSIYDSI